MRKPIFARLERGKYSFKENKYRVLRSYEGDHLNQRVPWGTDRTKGMVMISEINQLGPQKLKFQVSKRSELIWQRYRDIEGSRGAPEGLQRVPEGADRTGGMARISGINQLGPQKLKFQVS